MAAYYNELDPNAAEWLRQLMGLGAIAPGFVDERDIRDVPSDELTAYDQCHFFAGIGTWSYALRQAGWPDDRPVWTGSCPCQPYSQAGKGKGADDERNLWWAMFWLISQCRPPTIIGEQVSSEAGLRWWDLVSSDLEGSGYAATAFDLCAAGLPEVAQIPVEITDKFTGESIEIYVPVPGDPPHIRQRLFWVANTHSPGREWTGMAQSEGRKREACTAGRGKVSSLADSMRTGGRQIPRSSSSDEKEARRSEDDNKLTGNGQYGFGFELGDTSGYRQQRSTAEDKETKNGRESRGGFGGPSRSFWGDAIWIPCRDRKSRPIKPGTFPLVDGVAPDLVRSGNSRIQTEETAEAKTMRLKGYGNAIVAPLAVEFIAAYMEVSS